MRNKKYIRILLGLMVISFFLGASCSTKNVEKEQLSGEPPPLSTVYIKPTKLQVENNKVDFGTRKRGDTVNISFKVANTGDATLFIEDAMVDCSCMKPNYPKEIKIGESALIDVKFLTNNYLGEVRKHVVLKSNVEDRFSKLTFFGNIVE